MNGLSTLQMQDLEAALEQERERLDQAPSRRSEIAAERAGDSLDEVQRHEAVVLAVHALDASHERRMQVQAALDKMREGDYGLCEDCEDSINPKRLSAAPWARLCISCQSEAETDPGTVSRMRWAA